MTEIELSNREYAVLRGLAAGLTQRQIATRMTLPLTAIERTNHALRERLGAATAAQLIDRAWRLGILTPATGLLPAEKPLPPVPHRVVDPPALIRKRRHDLVEALRSRRAA